MAILIAELILLLVLALNIPFALKSQKKFLSTCDGDYKIFQDANLKKFTILFFIILIIAGYFAIFAHKTFFLLAAAMMLFLLVGSFKNAMIITKDRLFFRECAVPLSEITSAELTYTGKGKVMILFIMKNNHKFGYAHPKSAVPEAIAKAISELGIPVTDKVNKKNNSDVQDLNVDTPVAETIGDTTEDTTENN